MAEEREQQAVLSPSLHTSNALPNPDSSGNGEQSVNHSDPQRSSALSSTVGPATLDESDPHPAPNSVTPLPLATEKEAPSSSHPRNLIYTVETHDNDSSLHTSDKLSSSLHDSSNVAVQPGLASAMNVAAASTIPVSNERSGPHMLEEHVLVPAAADEDREQGDDDGGVIRCICDMNDDDGFTIQCDRCLVWQHCACFGMSSSSVPDEYLCEVCDPRPVDVAFAKALQQRRRDEEARKTSVRQPQAISSSASPAYLAQAIAVVDPASENTVASRASPIELDHNTATHHRAASSSSKTRKLSQSIDLSNTAFIVPEGQSSTDGLPKASRKKPGPKPGSRKTPLATPTSASTPRALNFPNVSSPAGVAREERAADEDLLNSADKLEAWHFEFTPIRRNMVTETAVFDTLAAIIHDNKDQTTVPVEADENGFLLAPLATTDEADNELGAEEEASGSTAQQPFDPGHSREGKKRVHSLGLSATSNECVPLAIRSSSLSDAACEVYVKGISEGAASAIFTNVLFITPLPTEQARSWSASRSFSKPVMHGLFAESAIPAGAFISEYRGELSTADSYRNDRTNQYHSIGATKPHVHLFPPPLSLAIDARRFGTEARFARFGCHPNAVIRPILFYKTKAGAQHERETPSGESRASSPAFASLGADATSGATSDSDPDICFGLFALRDIAKSHEIVLGWEWDDQHIVHFLPQLVQNPALETPTRPRSVTALDMANKGEFPYSSTLFARKMNSATTALLSTSFCSCIGSATPQGGSSSGSASSHNARKQDCAVAQMLRVGQGMGLMNVNIPGSARNSHRRIRTPSFAPLVGVRRWWRGLSMPLTPPSSADIEDTPDARDLLLMNGTVPGRITQPGKVIRVLEADIKDAVDRAGLWNEQRSAASEMHAQTIQQRGHSHRHSNRIISPGDESNELNGASQFESDYRLDDGETDEEQDPGVVSDVSSITEPLEGLSDLDSADDSLSLQMLGANEPDGDDSDLPTVLPLKKRIAGTRLKANHILADDPDREDKTNRRNARKAERAAATNKARAAKAAKRQVSLAAARKSGLTKHKDRKDVAAFDADDSSELSSEDDAMDDVRSGQKSKRQQRQRLKLSCVQPSSPLTSASEGERNGENEQDDDNGRSIRAAMLHEVNRQSRRGVLNGEQEDEDMSSGSEPVRSGYVGRPKTRRPSTTKTGRAVEVAKRDVVQRPKRKRSSTLGEVAKSPSTGQSRRRIDTVDDADSTDLDSSDVMGGSNSAGARRRKSSSKRSVDSSTKVVEDDKARIWQGRTSPTPLEEELSTQRSDLFDPQIKKEGVEEPLASVTPATPALAPAEPEKPRARLSLADWKKQQAEKRKAEAAAVMPTLSATSMEPATGPATTYTLGERANSAMSPPLAADDIAGVLPSASRLPPPPLSVRTSSYGLPVPSDSGSGPSATFSLSEFPPAPLPPRVPDAQPAPDSAEGRPPVLSPPPLRHPLTSPKSPEIRATASPVSSFKVPERTALSPRPSDSLIPSAPGPPPAAPAGTISKPAIPAWPATSSQMSPVSSTRQSVTASRHTAPQVPLAPRASVGTEARATLPGNRAVSNSAISPPLGPSQSKFSASPPSSHALPGPLPRGGWSPQGGFAVPGNMPLAPLTTPGPDTFGSPLMSRSASASSQAAAHPASTGAALPSPSLALAPGSTPALPPSGPAALSTHGLSTPASRSNEPTPSPKGQGLRQSSAGFAGPVPAAPAALRRNSVTASTSSAPSSSASAPPGHIPSGPTAAVAAPFNPPKGPKALMTPAPPVSTSTTGSNAISLRAGGGSAGFAPVDVPGPPRAAQPNSKNSTADSGSEAGGSPPASVQPQRHLSILGRGAAAAAAASSSSNGGVASGAVDRANERFNTSPTADRPSSIGSPPFPSSGSFRGGAGGAVRGGLRGNAHHGHGAFPRGGGWGNRGGRGGGALGPAGGAGTGSNAGLGGVSGSGWAGRGRGRGGSMGGR
ncbi:hypothetical protein BCV69DRAFT_279991 [Microstroma glucosiphilum]|uniref:SET domain-containing protein n=1 Tax=Pseudomicrostroma glucosiphilum TaxID=1684307 RepID=A0A316UFT5_9BASI|nr:hypothetical protein BCV69DRAFT_279991 [Pseudomicrostroma glucosiphilum]PWN24090.1 hypothetical protein BCV69DRAFT_279991 [Pseudomicrostroma glucosiphilum]